MGARFVVFFSLLSNSDVCFRPGRRRKDPALSVIPSPKRPSHRPSPFVATGSESFSSERLSLHGQTLRHRSESTCYSAHAMHASQHRLNLSVHPFTCFPLSQLESLAYVATIDFRLNTRRRFVSVQLVRHIMYHGCERDADLFSQSQESLVNILPKSYRGRCPLTKLGAFGLNKFHDIRLCDESHTHDNTGLLNHFVVFHYLSYPWANKLCNAMQAGDYDGSKQVLFKPNEQIKAKKWLTTQGKLTLAKRYSPTQKRKMMGKRKSKA